MSRGSIYRFSCRTTTSTCYSISTGALSSHFNTVEDNMKRRRNHIQSLLENSDETVLSITSFPRLGCPSFTYPERSPLPASSISRCLYLVLKYSSYPSIDCSPVISVVMYCPPVAYVVISCSPVTCAVVYQSRVTCAVVY